MALVLVAVVGGAATVLMSGASEEPEQPLAETVAAMSDPSSEAAAPSSNPVAGAASTCEASTSADLVTGNDKGDRDSAPGVILAFEHAYYEDRDAEKMIGLTSKDSTIRNSDALQEGIDSNPKNLTHCVRVAATDDEEVWRVEITQTADRAEPETIAQRITTTKEDGQWAVVKIEEASK